jgi:hypothetical protein
MGISLNDLERKGLAACAVVFTSSSLAATFCALLLQAWMTDSGNGPHAAFSLAAAFWMACMALAWWLVARSRKHWMNTPASTSIFHTFQVVAIGLSLLLPLLGADFGPNQISMLCFGFLIEVIVLLFYLSYFFLGFTLRSSVQRSAWLGLAATMAATWWSVIHVPWKTLFY